MVNWITTQIAPLVANAGNQSTLNQNVNTGGSTTTVGTGPGWATPGNTPTTSASTTTPGTASWAILVFIGACLYFAFQRMK
jgi:hypothetical protein